MSQIVRASLRTFMAVDALRLIHPTFLLFLNSETLVIIKFSEVVMEIEPSNLDIFGRILMKMLERFGYSGITLEEVNKQIEYFMKADIDVDISSLPEYNMDTLALCRQEIECALLEG